MKHINLIAIMAATLILAGCTSTPTPTTTNTGEQMLPTYTLAQVSEHKDEASCWTSINGNIYDLSAWIEQHPGGDRNILRICGIDGTSAFEGQHGGQAQPEQVLDGFQIGTLIP